MFWLPFLSSGYPVRHGLYRIVVTTTAVRADYYIQGAGDVCIER